MQIPAYTPAEIKTLDMLQAALIAAELPPRKLATQGPWMRETDPAGPPAPRKPKIEVTEAAAPTEGQAIIALQKKLDAEVFEADQLRKKLELYQSGETPKWEELSAREIARQLADALPEDKQLEVSIFLKGGIGGSAETDKETRRRLRQVLEAVRAEYGAHEFQRATIKLAGEGGKTLEQLGKEADRAREEKRGG